MNDDSTISAMRRTGLHRADFAASKPGEYLPREQARELPEPGDELSTPATAVVVAVGLGVVLLALICAVAPLVTPYLNR